MVLMRNKALSLIGLASRARKVSSGEFSVEKAIKSYNAFLVIIAEDASDNTKKKFSDMCSYYETPIIFYSSKDELGHSIGKEYRASLAILDENFAAGIMEKIDSLSK
jgi:ribosomal protein L7Ae-like RNA K-turn-binding protein